MIYRNNDCISETPGTYYWELQHSSGKYSIYSKDSYSNITICSDHLRDFCIENKIYFKIMSYSNYMSDSHKHDKYLDHIFYYDRMKQILLFTKKEIEDEEIGNNKQLNNFIL